MSYNNQYSDYDDSQYEWKRCWAWVPVWAKPPGKFVWWRWIDRRRKRDGSGPAPIDGVEFEYRVAEE